MFRPTPDPLDLEILVVPDATLILVAAVIEPLRAANRILGRRQYRWTLTTPDGAPVMTTSGIPIPAARPFTPQGSRDPLLVVARSNVLEQASARLIKRHYHSPPTRPNTA